MITKQSRVNPRPFYVEWHSTVLVFSKFTQDANSHVLVDIIAIDIIFCVNQKYIAPTNSVAGITTIE